MRPVSLVHQEEQLMLFHALFYTAAGRVVPSLVYRIAGQSTHMKKCNTLADNSEACIFRSSRLSEFENTAEPSLLQTKLRWMCISIMLHLGNLSNYVERHSKRLLDVSVVSGELVARRTRGWKCTGSVRTVHTVPFRCWSHLTCPLPSSLCQYSVPSIKIRGTVYYKLLSRGAMSFLKAKGSELMNNGQCRKVHTYTECNSVVSQSGPTGTVDLI